MTGTDLKWSKMVGKCSGNGQYMARKWLKLVSKCTGNMQERSGNCRENVKWSGKGPKWPGNVHEMSENGPRCSANSQEMPRKWLRGTGNVKKWSGNGPKWYNMV